MTATNTAASILVVEDNYLIARQVCDAVRECGFAVAGPVARVENGISLLRDRIVNGALVDIDLRGSQSYPICSELRRRNVPFAFLTGYSPTVVPKNFRDVRLLAKPFEPAAIRSALSSFAARRNPQPMARGNFLLDGLSAAEWEAIAPTLERARLPAGHLLESADGGNARVWFPCSGVVAAVASAGNHRADVGLVGREGLVGLAAIADNEHPAYASVVRFPCEAWGVPVSVLHRLMAGNHELQRQVARYIAAFMAQLASNTLAASQSRIRERTARWLLMIADRLATDVLPVTHNDLAIALGVRRPGITVTLHELEEMEAIRALPKRLRILDRQRLSEAAGGFYGPAEQYYRYSMQKSE